MKSFLLIFLVVFITSCSDVSVDKNNGLDKRNIGVKISNQLIGGSTYTDSSKKTYAFRSIRSVIKNDTITPIKIQFDIPTTWTELEPNQGQKYVCFLLPDTMTSDKLFDVRGQISSNLNTLINSKSDVLTTRTLTIQPNDTCSIRFGFLIVPTDGTFSAILFSQKTFDGQINNSGHDLRLSVTLPPVSSLISVGSLTFLNQ